MADITCRVGDARTLEYDLEVRTFTGDALSDWTDTACTAAYVMVVDPGRYQDGVADSATASSVTDTTFDDSAGFWNYCEVEFLSGDCAGEVRRVSDFASGVFSLDVTGDPLPATPAAGDRFRVSPYPIVAFMDLTAHTNGSISTEALLFQVNSSPGNGVTASPGLKRVLLVAQFSGADSNTDQTSRVIDVDVRPLF